MKDRKIKYQDRKIDRLKRVPDNPRGIDNSLNYCKLDFEMQTSIIESKRLENRIQLMTIQEQEIIMKNENHIGFSLSDYDAIFKLDQLSKTTKIAPILYHLYYTN